MGELLKPCFRPGCDGKPDIRTVFSDFYQVFCGECKISTGVWQSKTQAKRDWNNRSAPKAPRND